MQHAEPPGLGLQGGGLWRDAECHAAAIGLIVAAGLVLVCLMWWRDGTQRLARKARESSPSGAVAGLAGPLLGAAGGSQHS